MIHVAIVAAVTLTLLWLVRHGLIQVDMSFPWLLSIVILGFFSTNEEFVAWFALQLGILYAPIAIVLVTIFIILALITVLLIGYTRLHSRQIRIVRYIASQELSRQEKSLSEERGGEVI